MKVVCTRIPDEAEKILRKRAEKAGISISEYLRFVLMKFTGIKIEDFDAKDLKILMK